MAVGSFRLPISAGEPAPTTGEYRVRFIDFDGTVLKEEWLDAGGTATAPTTPTHTYLTFDKWVAGYDYTDVQNDIDVGALYNTTDDKSYFFITVTPSTTLSVTLYVQKYTADAIYIDWGDTNTSSGTSTGNLTFSNTYADEGDYLITMESVAEYRIGHGSVTTLFGNWLTDGRYILTKAYLHSNVFINDGALMNFQNLSALSMDSVNTLSNDPLTRCRNLSHVTYPDSMTTLNQDTAYFNTNLKSVVIPSTVTSFGNSVFNTCTSLESVVIPSGVTSIGTNVFASCSTLEKTNIPSGITTIPSGSFNIAASIRSIIVPSGVTLIDGSAFSNNYILTDIQVLATTPPTLSNINVFTGINKIAKIYVPDASVAAYKAATNWVTYADYIYPLSSRP